MNRLIETVLLSTHNICFDREIRKNIFNYALLSQGLSAVCALPGFTTGKKIIEEYESAEIKLKTCHQVLHWTVFTCGFHL